MQMDNHSIEASLKRIDHKFTEEMTISQRKQAMKLFRRLYSEQMGKIASDLIHKQKIHNNLQNINKKEAQAARQIDQQLKKKMEKHFSNRKKEQEVRLKSQKLMDQNWKIKLQEMISKTKAIDRQAHRKSVQMRKESEQFWIKKAQTAQQYRNTQSKVSKINSKINKLDAQDTKSSPYNSLNSKNLKRGQSTSNYYLKLPNQTKLKLPGVNKQVVSQSFNETSLNMPIKSHRERKVQNQMQKEQSTFQKIMYKLDKIQQTRKSVQNRMQKQIQDSKKQRELRQNPENLKKNRQLSRAEFSKSRKKNQERSKQSLDSSPKAHMNSFGGSSLDESIAKHLQTKKRIVQEQFQQRQNAYEARLRRMRYTKISRLVREAVKQIKHQTLNYD